jgi:hypothetical protein
MSELAVMDSQLGDNKIEWNADVPAEVAAARAMFNTMKEKRYLAYTLDESGHRGEVLREFDPEAERIIMTPQRVGG